MEVTNKSFFPTSFGRDCFQGNLLCFQPVSCVKYKRCNMMMIIVIIIIIMIIIILMIIIITIMIIAIIVIIIMTM